MPRTNPTYVKRRHYNALWRVLDQKRTFTYGQDQAFMLRRMVGQGFVNFFRVLKGEEPVYLTRVEPRSTLEQR